MESILCTARKEGEEEEEEEEEGEGAGRVGTIMADISLALRFSVATRLAAAKTFPKARLTFLTECSPSERLANYPGRQHMHLGVHVLARGVV